MSNFKFQISNFKLNSGQSLVELLLVIGLCAVILPVLLVGFVSSREGKAQQYQRSAAVGLLRETVEAVRSVRERDWASFAVNGTYYPVESGSSWMLTACSPTCPAVNGLTTQVEISDVERDSSGAIVETGTVDPSTKKVKTTISWGSPPFGGSIESALYLTRYLDNNAFTETTEAQFSLGATVDTEVINTINGEVGLGPGGGGDWCAPNLSIQALDLPKSGVANAVTASEGRAFAVTGENAAGVSFADINIPVAGSPPIASLGNLFSGYKTNDVFGETNYAYIATDNNAKEIVVIDLDNVVAGEYQEAGYFDSPGPTDGESVYVSGSTGFMTAGGTLYSFSLFGLPNTSVSRQQLDSVSLAGDGNKVIVNGNYAYVAVNSITNQLQIFDVGDPGNMFFAGQVSLNDKEAQDVFVNGTGTRAYVVTDNSAGQNEFFIIDTTIKSNPQKISGGSYDTGSMSPKGVTAVAVNNKAIVVGSGGEEYQVVDIQEEDDPKRCGGLEINSGVKGVSSLIETDGDAYSYIVTGDVSAEFKIIKGGPGGGVYTLSGTFESKTSDALSSVAYNRFDVSVDRPTNSDIQFQVAVKPPAGPDCTAVIFDPSDFVGPSGTSADKFQTAVTTGVGIFNFVVPFNINPGQCFRYKAYLSTTDFAVTPTFHEIKVNYSP